jgi:hypothetical protein
MTKVLYTVQIPKTLKSSWITKLVNLKYFILNGIASLFSRGVPILNERLRCIVTVLQYKEEE